MVDQYDAAVDTAVGCSLRELDDLHPNSRFILTIRDHRTGSNRLRLSSTTGNPARCFQTGTALLAMCRFLVFQERTEG
jgi:hypothetical protein